MITRETVFELLYSVIDPDLNCSIVDIGLIYDVFVSENSLKVTYTLTSPFCPAGNQIHNDILGTLRAGTDCENIEAELVWMPTWSPKRMSEELRLSMGLPI